MAVKLSRRVARFNRAVTNPIQGQFAWLLPPWAVICHHGRRTGRRYRTPVYAFRRGATLAIVVLYGEESDWVRNLLAGPAQVVRAGRTHELRHARMAGPMAEPMPGPARVLGRLSGRVLLAELGPASSGFGRGPAATA
jgi:deazaflavin-dependent oxidoreductase (nitroreductase family)